MISRVLVIALGLGIALGAHATRADEFVLYWDEPQQAWVKDSERTKTTPVITGDGIMMCNNYFAPGTYFFISSPIDGSSK